ncbi:hypothetical protein O6H91_09G071000 [Diphasiastrum complanatum]|uniref:Uncharacterized protein n=1 Tax=Diphasiastrum complanatum TaxID=34168 RepID=A0ACC2CQL5_DIPCM|nr:hypothetical protein O6H91_09G071000 [Diphasiastrum complanatum]
MLLLRPRPPPPFPSTARLFLSTLAPRSAIASCFSKHQFQQQQIASDRATILAPYRSIPLNSANFRRIDRAIAASFPRISCNFQSMASSTGTAQILTSEQLEEDAKFWEQVQAHQRAAVKLPHPEQARVVLNSCNYGTLSTISQKYEQFPVGSLVQFATDSYGQPVLAVSSLSPHTKDLGTNPKCSLMVPKDPQNKSSTIVTIIGDAFLASEQEWGELRALYLKKYPDAFWVDFGDFRIFRIEPRHVRFVTGVATGFAEVADFSGEELKAANVDAVAQFSAPISVPLKHFYDQGEVAKSCFYLRNLFRSTS